MLTGYSIDAGFEVALAAHSNDLLCHFTILEQQQRGDRTNAVLSGQLLLFVDVDLSDL